MSLIGTPSAAARSRSMVTRDLRRVEGQRVLHDDEAAGRLRLVLDLLGHLVDLVGVAGRADDVLDRQAAAGAGQRRRREDEGLDAGDLASSMALDVLLGSPPALRSRSAQSLQLEADEAGVGRRRSRRSRSVSSISGIVLGQRRESGRRRVCV